MPKNQLFRQTPPQELCERILHAFGLKSFSDPTFFSRKDLEALKCVQHMNELREELQKYYLPCKARTYLNELNSKNVITILRQISRLYGYAVASREKYIKGAKFIIYQLVANDQKYQPMTISTCTQDAKSCIVRFD